MGKYNTGGNRTTTDSSVVPTARLEELVRDETLPLITAANDIEDVTGQNPFDNNVLMSDAFQKGELVVIPNPDTTAVAAGGAEADLPGTVIGMDPDGSVIIVDSNNEHFKVDPSQVRAQDLNAAAIKAIDTRYGRHKLALQNRLERLEETGASIPEIEDTKYQLAMLIEALKADKVESREAAEPVEVEPTQVEMEASINQDIKAGKNPVELYAEHSLGVNPQETKRMQHHIKQIGNDPDAQRKFVQWASDNKALSGVVAYSKAQKALEGTTSDFLQGTNPISKLSALSQGLGELSSTEISRIPEIMAGTQEYSLSEMDDFADVWENGTVVVFDTETTGTEDNALILQIGATKHYADGKTKHFNVFVNQTDAYNKDGSVKAFDIHKISRDMISKGSKPAEAYTAFNAFLADADAYVAHKVSFDIGKIKYNFKEAGIPVEITSKSGFDSITLARESFYRFTPNRKDFSLGELRRDLKVEVDTTELDANSNAHRADYDASMLHGVLQKLYESHVNNPNKASIKPSREKMIKSVAATLLSMFPDTNPMLAIKDLLYAQEVSDGVLGITNKPRISTSNKASTFYNFDAASTAVDDFLISMMASVADKDGIEQVLGSLAVVAGTNANTTNTLFALAQQFNASKELVNMDRVVADAMTLAVFSEGLDLYGHEVSLDAKHGNSPALAATEEEQLRVNEARRNQYVGEKVQKLLGIPVGDSEVSAALGSIAITAVSGALQVNKDGEGSFGINSNLTPSGRVFAYQLAPLSQALIGAKADKDHYRTKEISKLNKKATRIKGSAPEDVFAHVYDKLGHDNQWQQDALLELSNMGFTWDVDLFRDMDKLVNREGFNELLKIVGYTDAEGNETKGTFNAGRNAYTDATDDEGNVIPKQMGKAERHQALSAGHKAGELDPKETQEYWEGQKHVYDPNSTDPLYNRTNVQEAYHGDKLKDMNFQRLMSMIVPKDEAGKDWKRNDKGETVQFGGVFYTDWFIGLNGRFYMKQYIGNFQSSKAARSGIMAKEAAEYNSRQDIMELKAGVMKKFGGDYSKMGVEEAASHFNDHAKKWHGLMYPAGASTQNWSTNADAILDIANNEEKFLSLSAMREGARLWQEYGVDANGKRDNSTDMADVADISSRTNRKAIKSKFFTEVDGVANGTAHNAMQAGSFEAAAATNLNPLIALNSELFEHDVDGVTVTKGREGEDIYAISGEALLATIDSDGSEALKEMFKLLNMNKADTRNFMKKPVMIFAYGAGQITIKKSVREGLEEVLDRGNVRATITAALDARIKNDPKFTVPKGGTAMEWLMDEVGTVVNGAISTKFEAITKVTRVLSKLASAAVEQGITPSLQMPNGNVIIFGMEYLSADAVTTSKEHLEDATRAVARKQIAYDKAVADGKADKVINDARNAKDFAVAKLYDVKDRLDFNDSPLYVVRSTFNPKARVSNRPNGNQYQVDTEFYNDHKDFDPEMQGSILKAATQAAVLITHNLDATNMLDGIMAARKDKSIGSAAQVFDGIFMTPKDARAYSRSLNASFFKLHNEFHYLAQFKKDLEKLVEPGGEFDKSSIVGVRRMLRDIDTAIQAHKKLLRHFEFGDRFIHQFFWDGATAADKKVVLGAAAKAKKAGKTLYSLKEGEDEASRLRGQNANKLTNNFLDQYSSDLLNPYLDGIDARYPTAAK